MRSPDRQAGALSALVTGIGATRAHQRSVRAAAISCATAALVIAAALTMLCGFTFHERIQRDAARLPFAAAGHEGAGTVTYTSDSLEDNLFHTVAYIAVKDRATPPPPGVDTWPPVGDVLLSRQLLIDGGGERITQRYGHFAGVIGTEGLSVPDERFAYVMVAPDQTELGGEKWTRFGFPPWSVWSSDDRGVGENMTLGGLTRFAALPLGFALLPAMLSLLLARGVEAESRLRRSTVLEVIGASPAQIWLDRAGEALIPVAAGTAAGQIVVASGLSMQWRVPVTGWLVEPAFFASARGPVLLTSLAIGIGALIVFATTGDKVRGQRLRWQPQHVSQWWMAAVPACAATAVWVPDVVDPQHGLPWQLIYRGSVLGLIVCLPLSVAAAIRPLAVEVAEGPERRSAPERLIAAGWLRANAAAVTRTSAAVIAVIVLTTQALGWSAVNTHEATLAADAQELIGPGVVIAPGGSHESGLRRALPADVGLLRFSSGGGGVAAISGTCGELAALSLSCAGTVTTAQASPRAQVLLAALATSDTTTINGPAQEADPDLFLIVAVPPRSRLDLPELKETLAAHLPPGQQLSRVGDSWIGGAAASAQASRWIPLFAILCLAFLAVGITADLVGTMRRMSAKLAPQATIAQREFRAASLVSAWTVLLTFTCATLSGAAMAWVVTNPLTAEVADVGGLRLLWLLPPAVALVLGVMAWGLTASSSLATMRRWRPRDEE